MVGLSALLASSSPERLATFLAIYWLAGRVVSLRLAWAVRPSLRFRLAAVAGEVAVAFEIERRTGHRWSIGGLILGGLEVGTGILLIATDTLSSGVMITLGVWALASGTLLIVEAVRARRRASAFLRPRYDPTPQPTGGQG